MRINILWAQSCLKANLGHLASGLQALDYSMKGGGETTEASQGPRDWMMKKEEEKKEGKGRGRRKRRTWVAGEGEKEDEEEKGKRKGNLATCQSSCVTGPYDAVCICKGEMVWVS